MVDSCFGNAIMAIVLCRRSSGILDGSVGSDELLLDDEAPNKTSTVIIADEDQAEIPPILTGVQQSGSR